LLSDLPGSERVVPAKVFEYFATRRPILAVAPGGELAEILYDCPAARRFAPADVPGISAHLEQAVRDHQNGRVSLIPAWDDSRYDRRAQAGQLASILDSVQSDR
jgi:hypothetical protein